MELHDTLEYIGFTKNESAVYLTLLKHGEGKGYSVSQAVDMKRPNAYFVLEELRKKGYVRRSMKSGRQVFYPVDPHELLSVAKRHVQRIESALPQLLEHKQFETRPKVTYYEGVDGFKNVLQEIQLRGTSTEMLAFFAYEEQPPIEHVETMLTHFQTLQSQGVHVRAIVPEHAVTKTHVEPTFQKLKWNVRRVPLDKLPLRVSFELIGNTVWIISRHTSQALMIENADIADGLRSIFELVWNDSAVLAT